MPFVSQAVNAADLTPALQCYENMVLLLIKCNQWKEAVEKYQVVCKSLSFVKPVFVGEHLKKRCHLFVSVGQNDTDL